MTAFVDVMEGSFAIGWASRQQQPTKATPTPFPSLNAICGDDGGGAGLAPGWFVTIGGGTGQGKSLLAEYMALHAMKRGRRVAFLSLEMTHHQLAARFYAMATRTPIRNLERGRFSMDAFDRVWDGICDLQEEGAQASPAFFVNSEPLTTIDEVMVACETLHVEHRADWFVLDYLQLVSTGDEDSIYRQVTEVANRLRLFAHARQVTVLGLSQYNTPTARDQRSPGVYGLMGGGTIANNGDIVLLLDHSRSERDPTNRLVARTFLQVAKNRHGAIGEIPIEWNFETLTVREALPDEEHLWPGAQASR